MHQYEVGSVVEFNASIILPDEDPVKSHVAYGNGNAALRVRIPLTTTGVSGRQGSQRKCLSV